MNSFSLFEYIEQKHADVIGKPIKLEEVSLPELLKNAKKSFFACGGELRSVDDSGIARYFVELASQKHKENNNFKIAIMCGPWIYAGTETSDSGKCVLNSTIRELHNIPEDDSDWIHLYYNYVNVVESIEAGYLHNIIIDEEDNGKSMAYLEYPHGMPMDNICYMDRKWICSNDSGFVEDIIRIRNNFCGRIGIAPQFFRDAYPRIVERTIYKDKFYESTMGWSYSNPDEYEASRKAWRSGTLPQPRPEITPYYDYVPVS